MHSKLHGNVVHHDVELLLLVSMLFLLAIPKSPLILKDFYTLFILPVMCKFCMGPICALVPMGVVHFIDD